MNGISPHGPDEEGIGSTIFLYFYILHLFVAWENRGELGVIIYNEVIVSILNMRI